MPQLGDVAQGKDIGHDSKASYYAKHIWQACAGCGKERWVMIRKGNPINLYCRPCVKKGKTLLDKNPAWKGGRIQSKDGYIYIKLASNDFFRPMANKHTGYVREHRLIMAKHLNRCLLPWEIVHHKNGQKMDNQLVNLILLASRKIHVIDTIAKYQLSMMQNIIAKQTEEIKQLKIDNTNLRSRLQNTQV